MIQKSRSLRWGFVGTGSIAASMASNIRIADSSELVAVSSRKKETAENFANDYNIEHTFVSWADMIAWGGVDAVYVATPTCVKEEISVAAANNGKHVLCEKPFASLPSLRRITAACRENGVAFMDATHFVHHPRTADIKATMQEKIGWPWSVDSAFQVNLQNRGNIRFNPDLEPLGAIGDIGWYDMRAAVEYLSPGIAIRAVSTFIRRDKETGAAISGSGVILFDDGSTTTWNCGFDSGAVNMDQRISGAKGVICLDSYLNKGPGNADSYTYHKGGFDLDTSIETVNVEPSKPSPALMFEDFAAIVSDPDRCKQSIRASERTQLLLDAVWASGLQNEQSN